MFDNIRRHQGQQRDDEEDVFFAQRQRRFSPQEQTPISHPNLQYDVSQLLSDTNWQKEVPPIQRQDEVENKTGLPDRLKAGVENLSGMAMDDVRVHYNSSKPAQLNAHAYTQGQTIEVGPGQERHLPHEAWHVVQQMQGRVRPTMQVKGYGVNDDRGLEREADVMGKRSVLLTTMGNPTANRSRTESREPSVTVAEKKQSVPITRTKNDKGIVQRKVNADPEQGTRATEEFDGDTPYVITSDYDPTSVWLSQSAAAEVCKHLTKAKLALNMAKSGDEIGDYQADRYELVAAKDAQGGPKKKPDDDEKVLKLISDCGKLAKRIITGAYEGAIEPKGTGKSIESGQEQMASRLIMLEALRKAKIIASDVASTMATAIYKNKPGIEGLEKMFEEYENLSAEKKNEMSVNVGANPAAGEAYMTATGGTRHEGTEDDEAWTYHFGAVLWAQAGDTLVLENYAVEGQATTADYEFKLYGKGSDSDNPHSTTFHESHKASTEHGSHPITIVVTGSSKTS